MFIPLLLALSVAGNTEPIHPNPLQTAAGKLTNGVLTLSLEARDGVWQPDGPTGMSIPVAAFAEVGKELQNPGPLIRVVTGTRVRLTVRNSLKQPMWMFGLGEKRGVASDSVLVPVGESRDFEFTAADAGVFYYAGKTTPVPLFVRGQYDSQLNGAIVVDEPNQLVNDRVFMISWWFDQDSTSVSGLIPGSTMAINGLSWPHTERLHADQNETIRWRWINMIVVPHPLHLHGFYFSVDGKGNGASFKSFTGDERARAVTEFINAGEAVDISWTPNRPGNWVFHCHFASHMTSLEGLNKDRRHPDNSPVMHKASHDDAHFMAGLVLGVHVRPVGEMKASTGKARDIRLLARARAKVYGEYSGYGYALGENANKNEFTAPGPLLVLKKDEPVAINIVNQTFEAAAVHWHGIELESFPDGVPGFSGYGNAVLRAIRAGDSLTVRFTPPRAGTFMYHSHFNENQQIGSGMYGAIVVVDKNYDPRTDRVLLFSDNGPTVHLFRGPFPSLLLNGKQQPEPMEMQAGVKHRLRMINITAEAGVAVSISEGEKPLEWKMIARDGADLPASQIKSTPARFGFASGQIADFEFTPPKPGTYKLTFGPPPSPNQTVKPVDVILNVK